MTESPEHRLKRLAMRAHRRGIKEMDVILGHFADRRLASLDGAGLDAFEALLDEADHDLYQWVSGQVPPPAEHAALIAEIARVAEAAARG
ncbi:MAG: succinate dehydrogenase assembly factor 2 [Alphaproteobacteria bacterium]|nr:MAG: succinate dehydrogenase assembly factor 2 [Alphaproteobacteria bacterium]